MSGRDEMVVLVDDDDIPQCPHCSKPTAFYILYEKGVCLGWLFGLNWCVFVGRDMNARVRQSGYLNAHLNVDNIDRIMCREWNGIDNSIQSFRNHTFCKGDIIFESVISLLRKLHIT